MLSAQYRDLSECRAMMYAMTMTLNRLEFDLADRLRKTLRESDLTVEDMAALLLVNRNTVGSWINGRNVPRMSTLMVWAEKTNVPLDWLKDGQISCRLVFNDDNDGMRQVSVEEELELREQSRLRESNSRPSHYE